MPALSVILEDRPDGNIQVKSRSTRPLDPNDLSPAEMVMVELSGWIATTYKMNEEGVILISPLIVPETPPLVIP